MIIAELREKWEKWLKIRKGNNNKNLFYIILLKLDDFVKY